MVWWKSLYKYYYYVSLGLISINCGLGHANWNNKHRHFKPFLTIKQGYWSKIKVEDDQTKINNKPSQQDSGIVSREWHCNLHLRKAKPALAYDYIIAVMILLCLHFAVIQCY
jgi:hypothetical protein